MYGCYKYIFVLRSDMDSSYLSFWLCYVRSGDAYTSNGTAEMIKEIFTQLKDEELEITFRMDSGYFEMKFWKKSNCWVVIA